LKEIDPRLTSQEAANSLIYLRLEYTLPFALVIKLDQGIY